MRMCIHRGTSEIGGTCIELESRANRIVLDVGLPLDADDPEGVPLHPVPGFEAPDPSLLGVFLSHPHQDHYGLAHRLPPGTPFLMGEAARSILAAAALFAPSGATFDNVIPVRHREPVTLGSFTLTPYLVDHSAYDAYAVLVEADGRRVFYTGDFRAHGRKRRLVEELIADPPRGVDVLLIEGTQVGRPEDEGCASEWELEEEFVGLLERTAGLALVWCSGQNIDRLVTVYRACRKARRQLILDMYAAEILRATGNANLPQAHWDGVRVYLPGSQKARIIAARAFEVANRYKEYRIYPDHLAEAAQDSVMLFRPGMMSELERAGCLTGARMIYSMWKGYLDREQARRVLDWLAGHEIPLDLCHTSGHAAVKDLVRLREAMPQAVVVPVHTAEPGRVAETLAKVNPLADGTWWDLR